MKCASRVKCLRAWVDLFHFTFRISGTFHNARRALFHICPQANISRLRVERGRHPKPRQRAGKPRPYKAPRYRAKAPLQGELSAEPTEGSPPHPRFPTVSHTGRRGRRPLRTQPGTLPQDEIKFVPSHAAGIFHTRSVFHMTKEYFTRPQGGFHWPHQRPVLSSR